MLRRISISPEEGNRYRTASERITMLDAVSIQGDLFGISPLEIQKKHDDALAIKLTTGEREAVYEAVVELVKRRLEKARSV